MYHGIKRQTVICRVAEGTQSGNLVRHGAKHMSDWCRLLKALLKSRFTKTWPRGNIYKKRREVNDCFRSTRNALTKMPREKYKNNSDLHRRCWHTSKIGDAGRNQQRWGRSYRWDSTRRIPPFFLKANSLPPNKKAASDEHHPDNNVLTKAVSADRKSPPAFRHWTRCRVSAKVAGRMDLLMNPQEVLCALPSHPWK